MVKRIVTALILVAVLAAGYWAYLRYTGNSRLRNGEVTVADPEDNPVQATPSRSDTPGTVNTEPVATTAQAASPAPSQSLPASSSTGSAPASDSQAPNSPNGVAFAGSGQFQVYRQGNLTWRINTSDGSTCILFATNEEWRKPVVYAHGCPNS